MLLALAVGNLLAFAIFAAIICLVAWGLTTIPKPAWINTLIWVLAGVIILWMVYDVFTSGHSTLRF